MPVFYPRILLISLVILVHGALLLKWSSATVYTKQPREMTVSLLEAASTPAVTPLVKTSNAAIPPEPVPSVLPIAPPTAVFSVSDAVSPSTTTPVSAVSVLPDREPDYQASYLNNPKPTYPNVAARMGWQGRVVIQVEVLTTGLAGQVSVQHSSGHEVLDDAALQAVRHWRFTPARHQGLLTTQYFLVPIPFVLKDSDE